jgi:hypothetical protein
LLDINMEAVMQAKSDALVVRSAEAYGDDSHARRRHGPASDNPDPPPPLFVGETPASSITSSSVISKLLSSSESEEHRDERHPGSASADRSWPWSCATSPGLAEIFRPSRTR